MQFQITYQFVRRICKETLKAAHKCTDVSAFHFADKMNHLESRIRTGCAGIGRQQELNKSFFYFPIGEA